MSGQSLLARLGLSRPEVRAWALYDWANSPFQSTVINAVFPLFFASYAAKGLEAVDATARFAWATTIAVTIVAIAGPVLGAIADFKAWKKRLLAIFMVVGVIAVLMMAAIQEGAWMMALAIFILANIGDRMSWILYDSLLPHIATRDEMDRVSTAAYAIGYIGGGILLLGNLAWILTPKTFGLPDTVAATKLSFISVALWWLLFSFPLFRRVPEPPRIIEADEARTENAFRAAFGRVGETFRELRTFRNALLMLIAFLLYNDGIQTMIRMAAVYGAEVGIDSNAQIAAFVLVQFVGVPFSFLFGMLADRIGAKPAVLISVVVYTIVSIIGYFLATVWQFFLLAFLVGTVQGGSQALSRSLFARMIPRHKSSEYFGFFSIFEKFSGIAGPLVFAASVTLFGNSRAAVLSIILFFILGALVLTRVNVGEGEAQAAAASLS
ncbi:MAG TPA: MFS transporter [Vicinamibacterales bacterium]|jgi:UMF1 family MFS transporter|nr:MFS transporter [Vicinamibacterales bacterium]